ncbi:MAG: hypothetical protein ACYCW6_21575 [Candidatus Xenobia bacterium]
MALGDAVRRLWWLVLLALLVVRWHNWQALPSDRGYDNYSHRQMLQRIVVQHTFPLANQGWSGYQPPLYYLTTGAVWHLGGGDLFKTAQLVSTLASFLLLACAGWAGRRLLPQQNWFVMVALAALPAEIMLCAMIYNIELAAAFAAVFLCLLLRAWPRQDPVWWEEVGLGLSAGATWMSRPDGACLGLVLMALLLVRLRRGLRRDAVLAFALSCMCVGACTGWYLTRNLAHFGRPLMFNADYDCMPYVADDPVGYPGFHSVAFYTANDFSFFTHPDFPSQTPYLLGMTYAAAWWAHLGYFYRGINPVYAPWLLALGLVPTALSCWGLGWVLCGPQRRCAWAPVLALGAAALVMDLIIVTTVPIWACVKPVYLYEGFVPWALLVGAGVAACAERWPRAVGPLTAGYAAFALFVGFVFWCR